AGARPVAAVGSPSPSQGEQSASPFQQSPSPSEVGRADHLCKDDVQPSSLSKKTVDAVIEACSIVIGNIPYGPKVVEAFLIRGNLDGTKHEYAKAHDDFKTVALSTYASDEMAGAAASFLGTMSVQGEFVDESGAMFWFQLAARNGDRVAMANIARLYAK